MLQKSLGAGTGGLLSQDVSSQALHAGLGDVNSLCHAMRSLSWAEWLPHAFPARMELSLLGMVVTAMQKSLRQSSDHNAHSNFLSALNTPSSGNRSFQNEQSLIQHFLCDFCCCFAFVFLFFPFGSDWQGSRRHSALRHWWPQSQFLVWLSLGYPTRPHPV